jgi:glutamyl-Q tRNA(Asp) synthetase
MVYIGRFAPSPTGPLHFGSLLAALASYLAAKHAQGQWLVRIEDVDITRSVNGAAHAILSTLEAYGLHWDGEVVYQSQRSLWYEQALALLQQQNLAYPCSCSRKEIADSAMPGIDGLVYPGTCRQGLAPHKTARAWRVNTQDAGCIRFYDQIQGPVQQQLAEQSGDFILKRADGLFAYQLAVVVDDSLQGVTHIVRGADLLDSTPRQIYLQTLLGAAIPEYAHIPVLSNAQGEKLSKQTLAPAIGLDNISETLWQALSTLGQQPPAELQHYPAHDILNWAIRHWNIAKVTKQRSLFIEP